MIGDVSETIRVFFEKSKKIKPSAKSLLTLDEVDDFLIKLSQLTKEDEQIDIIRKICKLCTSGDLKMVKYF